MGGVAGHMDHLYDDRDLTFAGMKEVLSVASQGNLSYEEKVDGQNIFLSYDLSANPPRAVVALLHEAPSVWSSPIDKEPSKL